ncbi:MAG: tetratricopeptide repeat protein [Ruminococcus callidus]
MKKRRFDWLRKTSSADVMNPKNYEYRLKQLDDDNPAEQKEAYTWFQKHAEEGDASAQYQTAMCFLHGVGVEKDEEQFLYWLTKSAEQEYGEALTTWDSLFL